MTGNLRERKWRKFLYRARLFRFIPFTEFVLASGSLATGYLHENSDFDVLVGARSGRIFTNRFLAVLFFSLFGWRRKKFAQGKEVSDKICLNHFVTRKSYCLRPPYDIYFRDLYQKLVPIWGEREKIDEFFKANLWLKPPRKYSVVDFNNNPFHLRIGDAWLKKRLERLLVGRFGDFLENLLKTYQVKRIEATARATPVYQPRLIYNDDELEFHPVRGGHKKIAKSDILREKTS